MKLEKYFLCKFFRGDLPHQLNRWGIMNSVSEEIFKKNFQLSQDENWPVYVCQANYRDFFKEWKYFSQVKSQ